MATSEPPPLPPPHHRPLLTLFTLPLSLTKRIRLTCFDLSPSLLVVGTATGSVYYYHRPHVHAAFASLAAQLSAAALLPLSSPFASRPHLLPPPILLRLLTLGLPPASASLTRVSICPHQPDLLALTTASSLLILHCPPHSPQQRERLLHRLDSPHISHLLWTADDSKRPVLLSADGDGQLMRTVVPGGGGGLGLAQRVATEVVCKLDSAIVQLSSPAHPSSATASSPPPFLLISTLTRSYIVTQPSAAAAYKAQPIGSKPRKEPFTACVDPSSPPTAPQILASRPGKRIWRSDLSGCVLSTLIMQPPAAVSTFAPCASSVGCALPDTFAVQAVQYNQLSAWGGGVVAWAAGSGWWLYVDVGHVCVVDWMVGLGRLMDVRSDGSECWLMHDREEASSGGAAAALDDAVNISIVYSSSPYSHVKRLLSSAALPAASDAADGLSPLSLLVHFAVKHRLYDRSILTWLQQSAQQQPLEASLQPHFDALIVEAERAERLGRREDYWDDDTPAHEQQQPAIDAQQSSLQESSGVAVGAAIVTPSAAAEVGGLAGVRSALSSAATQLASKLAQPQLGSRDKAREKDREAATANTASTKPASFFERTSALFSSATAAAAAPSPAAVTAIAVTAPTVKPIPAPTNSASPPLLSTLRAASRSPSLDSVPQAGTSHSGRPSPINPFLLSSSSASQPPKLTASSSFSSAASSTSAPVSPTPSVVDSVSDVFARASLLPADNLPFAEALEEAAAGREERKADGAAGRRRRVVDVGAAGEEDRKEREKRRRDKRQAERKKREKQEREKQRMALAAAAAHRNALPAHSDANADVAARKLSGAVESKEGPTEAPLSPVNEEKQPVPATADEQPSTEESSYASPSDTDEEEDGAAAERVDDTYVDAEGDDVTVMLHPSSASLFASMQTSPLAALVPCLRSMRWTLTAADIACREADVSFINIEGEDVDSLVQQRWRQAHLPSLPTRREGAAFEPADSGDAKPSVWSAVNSWLSEFGAAVQQCDALSAELAEDSETAPTVESTDELDQRLHRLQQQLSSCPPLLRQEIGSLLTLHLHLLLLSPQPQDVSLFLLKHRSLVDRLTVYSLLRHHRHPLCFALADLFPAATATTEGSETDALPSDPLVLASALPSLVSSPDAALASHLASRHSHIQPWMVADRLDLAASLSDTALHVTSPIPLVASLHSSLPPSTLSTADATASVSAVHRALNFYRAYLHELLHSPASPAQVKFDRSLIDQYLYLSLRLGSPATPPSLRTATGAVWPFSAELAAVAAQPALFALDARDLASVFSAHGWWAGVPALHVQLLLSAPSVSTFESALLLVLCLDDVQSLASLMAVLASSALDLHSRWTFAQAALAVYVAQLEQQPPPVAVSLSHLLHPLLLALGPPLLLQLLLSLPSASPVLAALPASFHMHLLAHSHRLHTLSRQVTAVVDTVDSYLWSERPAALPPQLRRGGGGNKSGRALRVWAEDAGGVDWGIPLGGEGEDGGGSEVSCGCCGVRIEWSERMSEAVVCFACDGRHVYHRQCLPELACVLCLMSNMRASAVGRLADEQAMH